MANERIIQRDDQLETQRRGYVALTLSEMDTTAEPVIEAGSMVEISGSLFEVTVNETITGATPATGNVWIMLVPDSGMDEFEAQYTTTAPTWSDDKQGWYDAGEDNRYVARLVKTAADEWDAKAILLHTQTPFNYADSIIDGDLFVTGDFPFSRREIFTASGTFNVPLDVTLVRAICVGRGGRGGNVEVLSGGELTAAGGGAGGTSIRNITVTPGSAITVTIGATVSFGAFCSATQGTNGADLSSGGTAVSVNAGPGGMGAGGDVNIRGGAGYPAASSSGGRLGGAGGDAYIGAGGKGGYATGTNSDAGTAGLYGGGGGGATAASDAGYPARNGGAGGGGLVIVDY